MASIVFNFTQGEEFPPGVKEEIENILEVILAKRYACVIDAFENMSIGEVVNKLDNDTEYLISIGASDKIKAKAVGHGAIFTNPKNEFSKIFVKKYRELSLDHSMETLDMDTIYTNNKATAAIYIVFDYEWVKTADIMTLVLNITDTLIDLMNLKRINRFGRLAMVEVTYSVFTRDKVFIMEAKDKTEAIKICNKYNGAVVRDSAGKIVHTSTFGKTNPYAPKKTTDTIVSSHKSNIRKITKNKVPRYF